MAKIFIGALSLGLLGAGGVLAFGFNPTTVLQQAFTALLMGSGIGGFISVLQGGAEYETKDGIKAWGAAAIFFIIVAMLFRAAGLLPTESRVEIESTELEAAYVYEHKGVQTSKPNIIFV